MKEWNETNWTNSFNSIKGLLYSDWYKAIKNWEQNKLAKILPPIEASLDPIHACNLQCEHCNAHKYLVEKTNNYKMTNEHLLKLVQFLGKWGVKAICFGGGGEPTLHTKLADALMVCKKNGMDASIATNGTILNEKLLRFAIHTCRWIGVSIDAATSKTYVIGRKANLFNCAIDNLKRMVEMQKKMKTNCDIAYKFLIFDYNQHEIFDACKLAKKIGVKDFHCRPADLSHQGMGEFKNKARPYNIEKIKKQFEKCHKLEDDNFHVYTIIHKFNESFNPIKNFSQCYASPCCIQLCADGNVYLCPDQRHQEFYKLGEHYPNPENILNFWGGEKHKELVFKTGKENCKTRCTFAPYCEQCERLFIKDNDPMCKWFI